MRKFIYLTAVLLAFAVATYAQTASSSSQSTNQDQSAQSGASATSNSGGTGQSSSTSGEMSQSSSASITLQGCILRQETDYFIQPISGSRVRLNGGDQDLSKYVGQDVSLHGHWNPYNNNNENNHQATTQPSGAPITGPVATGETKNQTGQAFLVTRVDKVADTCPTGTPGNTSNPQ